MKKNWTPFAACTLVRARGSVGLSSKVPFIELVNVRVSSLTYTVDSTSSPDDARSGLT